MKIKSKRVYQEGKYWRWKIVSQDGREYVDGGNYLTRAQAKEGLTAALAALKS